MEYYDLENRILRGKAMFSEIIHLTSDFLDRFDNLSPQRSVHLNASGGNSLKFS